MVRNFQGDLSSDGSREDGDNDVAKHPWEPRLVRPDLGANLKIVNIRGSANTDKLSAANHTRSG